MRVAKVAILCLLLASVVCSEYVHKCTCEKEKEVEGTCEKLDLDTCLVDSEDRFAIHSFRLSRDGNTITARTYLLADKSCEAQIAKGEFPCDECRGTTIYKCPQLNVGLIVGLILLILVLTVLACCCLLLFGCCLALVAILVSSGGFIAGGVSILSVLIGKGLKGRVEEIGVVEEPYSAAEQPAGADSDLDELSDI